VKLAHLIAGAALVVAVAACSSGAQPTESPSVAPTQLATLPPSPTPSATVAPTSSAPAATEYRIKKGDTLYAIAKRNKISLAVLLAANPQIKDPNKLKIGQLVYIPAR
jgi:LysM repeat protein